METAWALALLVTTLALSGCLGGGDDLDQPPANATGPASDAPPATHGPGPLAAPVPWSVGDHWTFETTIGTRYTLVVTEDLGAAWRIEATGEQIAFFDARTDVSTLGPQRKNDLAGSQNGTAVAFFRWPLTAGDTWTTTWDGVQRDITVVAVDDGVASLEAREGDVLRVTYSYDAEAGWFGHLTFHEDDGSTSFGSTLVDWGSDFTGEVVRWRVETVAQEVGALGAQPTAWGGDFVLAEGEEVWLSFHVQCPAAPGVVSFGVGPTAGSESSQGWLEPCPFSVDFEGVVDDEAGDKSYGMIASSPGEEGRYRVTVLKRALERVAVQP